MVFVLAINGKKHGFCWHGMCQQSAFYYTSKHNVNFAGTLQTAH